MKILRHYKHEDDDLLYLGPETPAGSAPPPPAPAGR